VIRAVVIALVAAATAAAVGLDALLVIDARDSVLHDCGDAPTAVA